MAWAYRMGKEHGLSVTERAVLRHVAYRAGTPTGECYETQENMADEIGVSRRSVLRALELLCHLSLLSKHPRFHQPTVYRLQCDTTSPPGKSM